MIEGLILTMLGTAELNYHSGCTEQLVREGDEVEALLLNVAEHSAPRRRLVRRL